MAEKCYNGINMKHFLHYLIKKVRNVSDLTDRNGNLIEKYRYDAFGNLYTGITAPYNTASFTGKTYDAKAGMVDMNARWYAPTVSIKGYDVEL